MKWTDDILLESCADHQIGQLKLAMYALHLANGHSIHCKQLKPDTIKKYVAAVASFLSLFSGNDYRKDCNTDQRFGHILAAVYADLDRYNTVPDRREPYTPAMHLEARRRAALCHEHPESPVCVLTHGFQAGLSAGFRLSEWAQPGVCVPWHKPQLNFLGGTRAVVPNDFEARTLSNRRLVGLDILTVDLSQIRSIFLTFRTQKNGDHGQRRQFSRNLKPTDHSFVDAIYAQLTVWSSLATRAPLSPDKTPLFCFWHHTLGSVCLPTSGAIEAYMRSIAADVAHINPNTAAGAKDLQRWSSHSLRVGACVILHAMGFSTLDIQWLLRWRSLAFMSYLRNLIGLANRQNLALDRAAAMSHLF